MVSCTVVGQRVAGCLLFPLRGVPSDVACCCAAAQVAGAVAAGACGYRYRGAVAMRDVSLSSRVVFVYNMYVYACSWLVHTATKLEKYIFIYISTLHRTWLLYNTTARTVEITYCTDILRDMTSLFLIFY